MHWTIRQIQSCTETEMSPSPPHYRQQPEEWQQCIKKLCNQQICRPPSCLTILAANGRACWVFLSYRKNLHSAKNLDSGKNSWQIDRIWLKEIILHLAKILSTGGKNSHLDYKIFNSMKIFSSLEKIFSTGKNLDSKNSWLEKEVPTTLVHYGLPNFTKSI